jgi:DNA-binding response OmpR family regulator
MQVLVVEDEPIIALDTAEMLMEAGHGVTGPASTVEEAVRLAEGGAPDLALIDINLCGHEDGPRVARALWELYRIPCLFVSAQPAQARQHRDVSVGVLTKPFLSRELLASVPAACAAAHGQESRSWRPKNLELWDSQALCGTVADPALAPA